VERSQDKTRDDTARHDKERQNKTRQNKTKQNKTKQNTKHPSKKTNLKNTNKQTDVGGAVRDVCWSESGDQVALLGEGAFFVLRLNREAVDLALAADADGGGNGGGAANGGGMSGGEGVDAAFDLVAEVPERARTALWVGDALVYTNAAWRLQYCVGGEAATVAHLDRPLHLIGWLAQQSRAYLIGRDHGVVSYSLPLPLIGFKAALLRGDAEGAFALLPAIPPAQHAAAARFLEGKGLVREALGVATDPDHRFDLAVQLGELGQAQAIAEKLDAPSKWRQLGELAMARGRLELAAACLSKARDLAGLLLLHAARGDAPGLARLADEAQACGRLNVAFCCRLLLGQTKECAGLLGDAGRLPEAALFARAYCPSLVGGCVSAWRADLSKLNARAAESLADPEGYPNLFPGFGEALEAERERAEAGGEGGGGSPALAAAPFAAAAPVAAAVAAAAAFAADAEEEQPVVADDDPALAAAELEEERQVEQQHAQEEEPHEEEAWGVAGASAAPEEEEEAPPPPPPPAPAAPPPPPPAEEAAEEDDELFQETHEEAPAAAAAAPSPPPPAPAATAAGAEAQEDEEDFGLDDEPAAAAPVAAAAAPVAAAAADDLNLDDDWGLDEE